MKNNDDSPPSEKHEKLVNIIIVITYRKWCCQISMVINNEYYRIVVTLVDSGANLNCKCNVYRAIGLLLSSLAVSVMFLFD